MVDDDLDVDGRIQGGWQYRLELQGGAITYRRDRDRLSNVLGRKPDENGRLWFSGAQAMEPAPDGGQVLGPVRQKGAILAAQVVGITYTAQDGTETPDQAYQGAVALLDVLTVAIRNLQDQAQQAILQAQQGGGVDSGLPLDADQR